MHEKLRIKMNECGKRSVPFLFAADFELAETIFIEYPLKQRDILFQTPLGGNKPQSSDIINNDRSLRAFPKSFEEYKVQFDIVMEALRRGDSFLTNLTVKTPIDVSLSLKEIFLLSGSSYRLYVPGRFVCFSPERFIKISEGVISTDPMKGTINAAIAGAADVILSDHKETAEHNTTVDLLRNDLGMVAERIEVQKFRYITEINTGHRNLLQISSTITGRLSAGYFSRIGDIVLRMLPAGSVSGAPKKSTLDIILRAEKEPRGFYTGVFGYFNGKEFDSAVIIRYIEEKNGNKFFRSGGGITVYSDPQSEYNEVLEKIYLPFL